MPSCPISSNDNADTDAATALFQMEIDPDNDTKSRQLMPEILLRRVVPGIGASNVYADAQAYHNGLCSFAREGLRNGDSMIIIATRDHLSALERELRLQGFDIFYLTLCSRYFTCNAESMPDQFMVNRWPDEALFRHLVLSLGSRMIRPDRNLRIFSEMAATMWLNGFKDAALELDRIWKKVTETTTDFGSIKLRSELLPPDSSVNTIPTAHLQD